MSLPAVTRAETNPLQAKSNSNSFRKYYFYALLSAKKWKILIQRSCLFDKHKLELGKGQHALSGKKKNQSSACV